jgi:hypothetical protein
MVFIFLLSDQEILCSWRHGYEGERGDLASNWETVAAGIRRKVVPSIIDRDVLPVPTG